MSGSRCSRRSRREAAVAARAPAGQQGFSLLEFVRAWLFVPSLAALAASLFLVIGPMSDRSFVGDEVIASHVPIAFGRSSHRCRDL